MKEIIAMVRGLVERGWRAYEHGGDVYFSVRTFLVMAVFPPAVPSMNCGPAPGSP